MAMAISEEVTNEVECETMKVNRPKVSY